MSTRTQVMRGTTYGGFAFASLLVAAVSGIALAVPFDPARPYDSIALILLANPGAAFFRNLHYWSSQAFVVLTILHVWDHFRRGTEQRVPSGMWVRVAFSIPIALFLMLSGFILRGDAEASQALRIIETATSTVPLIGRQLSVFLFGPSTGKFQVVYVHHIATATFFTWLFAAEHARAIWPRRLPVVVVFAAATAVALLVSPGLHDGLDPLVRGPWYFLGLQELLHWFSGPAVVMLVGVLLLALVLWLPRLSFRLVPWAKRVLAAWLIGYAAVSLFAFMFRGEGWALSSPGFLRSAGLSRAQIVSSPSIDTVRARPVPIVLGRREGCLFCHFDTRGLSVSHKPEAVGCASCHGGNPFSLDKRSAHSGLIAVPGNLSVAARTCALEQCHPASTQHVGRSVMTTMSGVISVDREVFGEASPHLASVASLGTSPADTHARQLCASCHLGAEKQQFGAIGETSRGGGCNACHLSYSNAARDALASYQRNKKTDGLVHPDLNIAIGNDRCFGCHSRSGRISLNYEGWQEQLSSSGSGRRTPDDRIRNLADGRTLTFVKADVHFEKGMTCVDCHTWREVMGDGGSHARKIEQSRIECEDCHTTGTARTTDIRSLDSQSRRIIDLRNAAPGGGASRSARILTTLDGKDFFVNTTVDADGTPTLVGKRTGATLELKRPASACVQGGGHERLSCSTCHTSWAPTCVGCHTTFNRTAEGYDHLADKNVKGAWSEVASDFRADLPTLGVRRVTGPVRQPSETIETFAPGMVLTIEQKFSRLYARVAPHTTVRGARSCKSCHNDPVALGYGRGTLSFGPDGRWTFVPKLAASPWDRLPADAWVGFLKDGSTRNEARPFSREEQKRILTVGACLTCHDDTSDAMRDSIRNFKLVLSRRSARCVVPVWP